MKAMMVTAWGDTTGFTATDIPKPELKPGHILVKVAASSVNTVDTMIRSMGAELPLAPALPALLGMDFAGSVVAAADDVKGFAEGDEVYGCAGGLTDLPGALAEYMLVDARLAAHKPKSISMAEAAAIPLVGITAYEGLTRAGVTTGQMVLVHGGGGGVGHIAMQLAKSMDAETFATYGRGEHKGLIEDFGITAINYRDELVADYVAAYTNGVGFDVVFDSVGGENMANSFAAAKLNGQVASTVAMVNLDLTEAHFKGLSLHVVFMLIPMLHNVGRSQHGEILTTLASLVDTGKLKPIVDSPTYTLDEVGKAHERLESGRATGKVVITI